MNPKVDAFFSEAEQWQDEYEEFRRIVLECGLTEELKWGVPCYTYKNANILIIHGFKEFCAINFFKGSLLKDEEGILVQQTENVQATRQIRVTSVKEIKKLEGHIKAYIFEAIEVEKAGLKINYKKVDDFDVPEEFQQKLDESPELKEAFEALTPGRQKGYLLHFSQAKQSATRAARVEKYRQRILNGKGINDCVCGLSKRYPVCDGSHKNAKK